MAGSCTTVHLSGNFEGCRAHALVHNFIIKMHLKPACYRGAITYRDTPDIRACLSRQKARSPSEHAFQGKKHAPQKGLSCYEAIFDMQRPGMGSSCRLANEESTHIHTDVTELDEFLSAHRIQAKPLSRSTRSPHTQTCIFGVARATALKNGCEECAAVLAVHPAAGRGKFISSAKHTAKHTAILQIHCNVQMIRQQKHPRG